MNWKNKKKSEKNFRITSNFSIYEKKELRIGLIKYAYSDLNVIIYDIRSTLTKIFLKIAHPKETDPD